MTNVSSDACVKVKRIGMYCILDFRPGALVAVQLGERRCKRR